MLRGDGKKKGDESPSQIPLWPRTVTTDPRPVRSQQPSKVSNGTSRKQEPANQGTDNKPRHKQQLYKGKNSPTSHSGPGPSTGTSKDTHKALQFEKRKALICFGADGSDKPQTPDGGPSRDSVPTGFEFLEDSAFAESLYATVISPLEKRRVQQSGKLYAQAPVNGMEKEKPKRECVHSLAFADTVNSSSGDPRTKSEPLQSSESSRTPENDRDILLESLLRKEAGGYKQPNRPAVSDLQQMLDSDRQSLLLGLHKPGLAISSSRPQIKAQQQKLRQHQQPNQPPPPPKRVSSIRKHHTEKQLVRKPVQTTNSPTSIEKLQKRLQENRKHSQSRKKYHDKSGEATHSKQLSQAHAQQQRQQVESHKEESKRSARQNRPKTISPQHKTSQRRYNQQLRANDVNLQDKQQNLVGHEPGQDRLADSERAHRARAARLMEIYEDVKKISRPSPRASLAPDSSIQPSNQSKHGAGHIDLYQAHCQHGQERNTSSHQHDQERNTSSHQHHQERNTSSHQHHQERNTSSHQHHQERNTSSHQHHQERNTSSHQHHQERNTSSHQHHQERNTSSHQHHQERNTSSHQHDQERNTSSHQHHQERNTSSHQHHQERNTSSHQHHQERNTSSHHKQHEQDGETDQPHARHCYVPQQILQSQSLQQDSHQSQQSQANHQQSLASDGLYKDRSQSQKQTSHFYQGLHNNRHAFSLQSHSSLPHRTQSQHGSHAHTHLLYHTSRVVSDHVTDVARKFPVPPRRFSDSESCREVDLPQDETGAIRSLTDQTVQDVDLLGVAAVGLRPARNSDPSMAGRLHELDSATSVHPSSPTNIFHTCRRRLSDTALYSSQFSDIDEMTSSMEEAMIVTPPPEFTDEPEVSTNKTKTYDPAGDTSSTRSGIPVSHSRPAAASGVGRKPPDDGVISPQGTRQSRSRAAFLDSAAVSRTIAALSPKHLQLTGPSACGGATHKPGGSRHVLPGDDWTATPRVPPPPADRARVTDRTLAVAQTSARSNRPGAGEIPRLVQSRSVQDSDIAVHDVVSRY